MPIARLSYSLAAVFAFCCWQHADGEDIHFTAKEVSVKVNAATWPQWRGPSQQGVSPSDQLPVKWSEDSAGKIEIPGSGACTPVVTGN